MDYRLHVLFVLGSDLEPQLLGLGKSVIGFCSAIKQLESTAFDVPGMGIVWI